MAFIRNLMMVGVLGGIVAGASAQTSVPLELKWKVQADDPASTYILSTTNNTRGLFLNTNPLTGGSLLVASRDNNNLVRRVDPNTGALKDPAVLPPGYSGTATTFAINKVVVDTAGIIYVGSLGVVSTAAEQHFRIYRHADEFSGPTLALDIRTDNFSGNGGPGVAARLGDDMDITGTGNTAKILVAGSGGFLYLFTTADGGLTFTGQSITCNPPLVGSSPNIAWDPTTPNRFFYRDATPNVFRAYDLAGNLATGASGPGNDAPGVSYLGYGPFDVGLVNGVNSFALGIGSSSGQPGGKPVIIFGLPTLSEDYYGLGSDFQLGVPKANANASGDVYLDSTNNALYVLYTNNAVTKFRIPGASVGEWSLYK